MDEAITMIKPGQLFSLTELGLAYALTVQGKTKDNTYYEAGFYHGFDEIPLTTDIFLLLEQPHSKVIYHSITPDVVSKKKEITEFKALFKEKVVFFALNRHWKPVDDRWLRLRLKDMIVVHDTNNKTNK